MSENTPLVVDLDGTLIKTDLLVETYICYVRINPVNLLKPLSWISKGKHILKANLANKVDMDVSSLPYNKEVIDFISHERQSGREIVLATASYHSLAEKVAQHLALFDKVIATNEVNISAENKKDELVRIFGYQCFDYMGNSLDDLIVWKAARYAYVVHPEQGVISKANKLGNVVQVFQPARSTFLIWCKALRVHQWLKNLLIFVPLLASHQFYNASLLLNGVIAFLLFGFCASSVYLLNDLLDLQDDRHHRYKRNRPLASGLISIKNVLWVILLLLGIALIGSFLFLPVYFVITLAVYYVLTLAYSLVLKRLMSIDIITLAILYTLRLIAGVCAFKVGITFWLLTFSMFIFLSLSLVKRYAELLDAKQQGKVEKSRGRGYYPTDLEMISSLGASSGYLSVMVLALYMQDSSVSTLYRYPQIIWLACPLLLFWITRTWLVTHRGQMHDDPIVFAIKDKISLIVGILFCLIFWLAA